VDAGNRYFDQKLFLDLYNQRHHSLVYILVYCLYASIIMSESTSNYTILQHPQEILGLTLSFLGVGHCAFICLACSRLKTAYLTSVTY